MSDEREHERRLIERVRRGDGRAYAELVETHKNRAYTLACRMLRNSEDAEELVQDAFVRAYRKLDQFREESSFGTWLYRIVYNLSLTRLRSGKGSVETYDELPEIADEEPSVLLKIANGQLAGMVRGEVESLPPKYRAAVVLFYLQEKSYEEVSEVMEMPLGTVKTYLHRARILLRRRLSLQLKGEVEIV